MCGWGSLTDKGSDTGGGRRVRDGDGDGRPAQTRLNRSADYCCYQHEELCKREKPLISLINLRAAGDVSSRGAWP